MKTYFGILKRSNDQYILSQRNTDKSMNLNSYFHNIFISEKDYKLNLQILTKHRYGKLQVLKCIQGVVQYQKIACKLYILAIGDDNLNDIFEEYVGRKIVIQIGVEEI